ARPAPPALQPLRDAVLHPVLLRPGHIPREGSAITRLSLVLAGGRGADSALGAAVLRRLSVRRPAPGIAHPALLPAAGRRLVRRARLRRGLAPELPRHGAAPDLRVCAGPVRVSGPVRLYVAGLSQMDPDPVAGRAAAPVLSSDWRRGGRDA